jgi:hypothetical protein
MAILGLLVTLLGFIISVASLGMASSVSARMIMTLVGLVVSLVGILGLINPAFQKNANWKSKG